MNNLLLVLIFSRLTSTLTFRIACERDDTWLEIVAADALLPDPELISYVICSIDFIGTSQASTS